LPANSNDIRRFGFSRAPVALPNSGAEIRVIAIDLDLLRSITTAGEVRVALNMDGVTDYFLTWRNGQADLANFLRRIDAGP
jgi:hypothetical protein